MRISIEMKNSWKKLVGLTVAVFWSLTASPKTFGETVCEILRPNSNVNTLWNTYSYTNIDDNVVNPGTPSSDAASPNSNDDYEEQVWGFTVVSATDIASVTAVHVNIHANDGHVTGDYPQIRIKAGGVWSSVQTAELEDGWYTLSYYDSWSVQEIDGLEVGINPLQMNSTEDLVLDAVYCQICGPVSSATPTPTPTPTSTPTPTPTPTRN